MTCRSVFGLGLLLAAGCGFPSAKVDEAKGHVQRALTAWQMGGKADDLNALSPPVSFHETLWNSGEKLVSFELGTAQYIDGAAVVRCEGKLTLRNRKGKGRTEPVVYDVTLGPPVKVVNNPMP